MTAPTTAQDGRRRQVIPPDEITADHPECDRCSWICLAPGRFVLKAISRACRDHGALLPPGGSSIVR